MTSMSRKAHSREGILNGDMEAKYDFRIPVLCTAVAALLLHAPGLYCKLKYNESLLTSFGAVIGAIAEGFLFLMLLTKAALCCKESITIKNSLSRVRFFLCMVLQVVLLVTFVVFSVADYTYQTMSGGLTPDMWVVMEGIQHAKDHAQAQFSSKGNEMKQQILQIICSLVLATIIHGAGQCYCYKKSFSLKCNGKHLIMAGLVAISAYAAGAWSPVLHPYLSFYGSFFFSPDGANVDFKSAVNKTSGTATGPNAILIMHESLSGAYALNQDGKKAFRFLQNMIQHNDDMYLFQNARSVSGDTTDAMTSIVTGCLGYAKSGTEMAFARSIATEFKRQGYHTGSFTTRRLDLEGTKWHMLHNYLTGNFDVVHDPLKHHHETPNAGGSDDRLFVPLFENWLVDKGNSSFFAQFYQFNSHFPYVEDKNSTASHRYYSSMETMDESLEQIFDILNSTGKLNSTIIIGTGDHGEYLEGSTYVRLKGLNPYILQPLTYMYVPSHLFTSDEARDTLRANQDAVISTLDLFPTMQHVLYGGDSKSTLAARNKAMAANVEKEQDICVGGFDLMSTRIPIDRVAISWNIISDKREPSVGRLVAVSNAERSMYFKGYKKGALKQFRYGNCTLVGKSDCVETLTQNDRDYWKNIVHGMYKSSTLSKQLMKSKFITYFLDELEIE